MVVVSDLVAVCYFLGSVEDIKKGNASPICITACYVTENKFLTGLEIDNVDRDVSDKNQGRVISIKISRQDKRETRTKDI